MNGWHLCKTAGKWTVRYLQDGRSYICDPASYERKCVDLRVTCDLNRILVGPDSVYSDVVRIKPPVDNPVITTSDVADPNDPAIGRMS